MKTFTFKSIGLSLLLIITMGLASSMQAQVKTENRGFREIYRDASVKEVQQMSKVEHKPIMFVITDKSCKSCKRLDSALHYSIAGEEISKNFIVKKMESSNLSNMMQASNWGINSVPAVVYMNSKGDIIMKAEGVINPDQIVEQSNNAFDKMKDQNNRYAY